MSLLDDEALEHHDFSDCSVDEAVERLADLVSKMRLQGWTDLKLLVIEKEGSTQVKVAGNFPKNKHRQVSDFEYLCPFCGSDNLVKRVHPLSASEELRNMSVAHQYGCLNCDRWNPEVMDEQSDYS